MTDKTDITERLRSSKQYDFKSPEMQRWQQDRLDAADEIERLRGALLNSLGVMLNEEADKGSVPAEWSRTCGLGVITEVLGIDPTAKAARAALTGKED